MGPYTIEECLVLSLSFSKDTVVSVQFSATICTSSHTGTTMTKTQNLLQNHLILVLAPLLLHACENKSTDTGEEPYMEIEEGTYYLNIEEDLDCPSLDEVNATLPEEEFNCSGKRFLEVT